MKSLLKFITCGSVDDGKSTLIGHILYDSKLLYADQKEALELESKVGSRGGKIDYSLLLDGLMAEREQGITIDVAYRYFTTDHRSFIVADTPGHEEYTRNMAVGASFADLAIILVDAKQGVLVQTRRHARICALMGIQHFIFAVNKMDLVGYSESRFQEIQTDIQALQQELQLADIAIIPVSATEGDNITVHSPHMPWYKGNTLLGHLETVDIQAFEEEGFYLPVQRVSRPDHTFRGFQGQVESGTLRVNDTVCVLPSGETAVVKSLIRGFDSVEEIHTGEAVTIQLDREVDVSRGCVIVNNTELQVSAKLETTLLWMDDTTLQEGREYLIMAGTKLVSGVVSKIRYAVDVNTGDHVERDGLSKNEIARCVLTLQEPIVVDTFTKHKTLGEFILIDRVSHMTAACGVIQDTLDKGEELYTFIGDAVRGRGDIFEEFYYDVEGLTVDKVRPECATYHVGDAIPLTGDSYQYPSTFDILILRDKVYISVRDGVITAIAPLREYIYQGVPLLNGRGFGIQVQSAEEYSQFIADIEASKNLNETFAKWLTFTSYRHIAFKK